ncbi:MAG: Na/Pi symporter [Patescibacteria group bacterium]
MGIINTIVTVFATITLFLFAVHKFARSVEHAAGEKFKSILATLTSTPVRGVVLGTLFTALIQSSTATIVTTQSLVDAGLLSFTSSLGVVFGANIGTTLTSQLIAFKLTFIAGYVVLAGFLLDHLKIRYQKFGKAIFYFGLIFFCLSLISLYIEPLQTNPTILNLLSHIDSMYVAILVGALITIAFQSSSITSGLAIILAGQGLLTFDQALGIVLGANVGTTSTALIVMFVMGTGARRTAVAHFLFNLIGMIIILPFLSIFSDFVQSLGGSTALQVANAHFIFNILSTIIFLIFLKPFANLVTGLVR